MKKRQYTIVLIDDQLSSMAVLKVMLIELPYLCIVETFSNLYDAFSFLEKTDVDILILDMDMPDMDGATFYGLLSDPPVVVICTAFTQYAYHSSEMNAVAYLPKLPRRRLLEDCMYRACIEVDRRRDKKDRDIRFLEVRTVDTRQVRIDIEHICYASVDDKQLTIHTASDNWVCRMALAKLVKLLPDDIFVQVHRSYVVSLKKIALLTNISVVLTDTDHEIPIGREYNEEFRKKYSQFLRQDKG